MVGDLRRRYPGAPIHGLLPARLLAPAAHLFDSVTVLHAGSTATYLALLARAFGPRRSGYLAVPCTGEGYGLLKVLFWLLPLGRREFHNENNDFYSARDVPVLLRHIWWRLRTALRNLPNLWWRLHDWLTRRPHRVTVLGSASGLYLKTIVADLRRRYPGAPLHGLLPACLLAPATRLFDSHTPLRMFSARCWRDLLSLALGRRRSGHLVIPCTNEGYTHIKLLGFCLPLGLREIYNENGDAYLPRHLRMLWRHLSWRLEHRIFYQALTARRRRPWLLHLVHLLLYPLRLAAGAALLLWVLHKSRWGSQRVSGQRTTPEQGASSEDVLALANGRLEPGEPVVSGDS